MAGYGMLRKVYERLEASMLRARDLWERLENLKVDAEELSSALGMEIIEIQRLCEYMDERCRSRTSEPEIEVFKRNVVQITERARLLREGLDTYTLRGSILLQMPPPADDPVANSASAVASLEKKKKKKSVVLTSPLSSTSGPIKRKTTPSSSTSTRSSKRKKTDPPPCHQHIGHEHAVKTMITSNFLKQHQIELGAKFCKEQWGLEERPEVLTLVHGGKLYYVHLIDTRLSKGSKGFLDEAKVREGDFVCFDIFQRHGTTLDVCVHKGGMDAVVIEAPNGLEQELELFLKTDVAQQLAEDTRKDYLTLCQQAACMPHGSCKALTDIGLIRNINWMVTVARQIKQCNPKEEDPRTIEPALFGLESASMNCLFLRSALNKVMSMHDLHKHIEDKIGQLQEVERQVVSYRLLQKSLL